MTSEARAPITTSHFWWRPGWRPGRSYLTWHIVVADDPRAAFQLAVLRDTLLGLPNYAPVADTVLHLTGPGVGFADQIDPVAQSSMVDAVAAVVAGQAPCTIPLANPWVSDTGVGLGVAPADRQPLTSLRLETRRAIARAGVAVPGNDDEDYRPHVTLAYATGEGPTAPARDALSALWSGAVPLRVSHWTLLALRMAPPTYEWDVVARLPLAGQG